MTDERWIVIPNWDGPTGFQHYRDRTPKWIKTYVELMSDDAYLGLTGNRRAILHGIWLEYAMARTCLRLDVKMLNSRLQLNVKMSDLQALNDAGFLTFSASKPLAKPEQNRSLEVEKKEKDLRAHTRETQTKPQNDYEREHPYVCPVPHCGGVRLKTERRLLEHLENAHNLAGPVALEAIQAGRT